MEKGEDLEHRQEVSHEVAIFVVLLGKGDGAVHSKVLAEERAGTKPHPVCVVDGPARGRFIVITPQYPVAKASTNIFQLPS